MGLWSGKLAKDKKGREKYDERADRRRRYDKAKEEGNTEEIARILAEIKSSNQLNEEP